MRISDDRYDRDRFRLDIAMQFIRHEARTHTIRQWTGLTDDRIRKLYHAYLRGGSGGSGAGIARHRGKSPHQAAFFLRTAKLRQEAAALAGICCLLGLLDRRRGQNGGGAPAAYRPDLRDAAGVSRAASLCQAYAFYRAMVGTPAISFEHAVLLVNALSRGYELRFADCRGCGALIVVDSLALELAHCVLCESSGDTTDHEC